MRENQVLYPNMIYLKLTHQFKITYISVVIFDKCSNSNGGWGQDISELLQYIIRG